jgi:hypothetical protein
MAEKIANFRAYEKVRAEGKYNMFDPRAIAASGLSKEDYIDVMKNYAEYREASNAA